MQDHEQQADNLRCAAAAAQGGHGHAETRATSARSAVCGPARPMSKTGPVTGGGSAGESPLEADGRSGDERPLPWLLRQKIAVPDRVAGYLDRAGLVERAMPTSRRLTVLQAPGGFGKTTLLAECCRRLRDDGVPVAWVSADEQDEPAVLDTYIAYACQGAAAGAVAGPEKLAIPGSGNPKSAGVSSRDSAARIDSDSRAWTAAARPAHLSRPGSARSGCSRSVRARRSRFRRKCGREGNPAIFLAFGRAGGYIGLLFGRRSWPETRQRRRT